MSVVIVATITPAEGKLDEAEAALRSVVPLVHQEDGCELYALHRGKDRLVMVEKWRDGAALGAHGSGQNMKTLNERLAPLVAGRPDIQLLEAVPSGDTAKGGL